MQIMRTRILVAICILALSSCKNALQPDPSWPPSPKPTYYGNGLRNVTYPYQSQF